MLNSDNKTLSVIDIFKFLFWEMIHSSASRSLGWQWGSPGFESWLWPFGGGIGAHLISKQPYPGLHGSLMVSVTVEFIMILHTVVASENTQLHSPPTQIKWTWKSLIHLKLETKKKKHNWLKGFKKKLCPFYNYLISYNPLDKI